MPVFRQKVVATGSGPVSHPISMSKDYQTWSESLDGFEPPNINDFKALDLESLEKTIKPDKKTKTKRVSKKSSKENTDSSSPKKTHKRKGKTKAKLRRRNSFGSMLDLTVQSEELAKKFQEQTKKQSVREPSEKDRRKPTKKLSDENKKTEKSEQNKGRDSSDKVKKKLTKKSSDENEQQSDHSDGTTGSGRYLKSSSPLQALFNQNVSHSNIQMLLRDIQGDIRQCLFWNNCFQKYSNVVSDPDLDPLQDSSKKFYRALSVLSKDFVHCAMIYGKIIISERFLPVEHKTLQPIDSLGGVVGGDKFMTQGILFKFAVDRYGLYGYNDHSAAKVANHSLKSLDLAYNWRVPGLHFPLMCLIYYRGFCLEAMSIVPIGEDTIVYGSADAGETIYEAPMATENLALISSKLNLKGHWVERSGSKYFMYLATDVEYHDGYDGKHYLVDLSRLMPPEYFEEMTVPGQHLFRLLRPELVRENEVPLSSDAFSGFGYHNCDIHNAEVKEATRKLKEVVIPDFASYLSKLIVEDDKNNYQIRIDREHAPKFSPNFIRRKVHRRKPSSDGSTFLKNEIREQGEIITELMHVYGINCRYLGLVRKHVNNPHLKKVLLIEVLARHLKNIINRYMRKEMKKSKLALDQPYKEVIVANINRYFNVEGGESIGFWTCWDFKEGILTHFPLTLSSRELETGHNLLDDLSSVSEPARNSDLCVLFRRVIQLLNITVSPHCKLTTNPIAFFTGNRRPVFKETHIMEMGAGVKAMSVVSYSEGQYLYLLSLSEKGEERHSLLEMALSAMSKSLKFATNNTRLNCCMADVLTELGKYTQAKQFYLRSIKCDATNVYVLRQYAKFCHVYNSDYKTAEECYKTGLKISPDNPFLLCDYALFLWKCKKKVNKAEKMFQKLCENHPTFAQGIFEFAMFLEKTERKEESLTYFEQASQLETKGHKIMKRV